MKRLKCKGAGSCPAEGVWGGGCGDVGTRGRGGGDFRESPGKTTRGADKEGGKKGV